MSRMLDKMNLISVVQQLSKEDIELVQNYVEMIEEENQELKKQLEERNIEYFKGVYDTNNKYYEQQKEFIKWLEDYLKLFDNMDIEEQASYDTLEEILQKFKEIMNGTEQN